MYALLQAFVFAQETTTTAEESEGSLIDVVPGLMVWTILTFLIVLWVLRRFAFGRIQGLIDQRRDRIREALDEADKARQEARELRELVRKEREEAKVERERMLVLRDGQDAERGGQVGPGQEAEHARD